MWQLWFPLLNVAHLLSAANFSVEIISPGNYRLASVSSMPITAPALDLAVEELNKKYTDSMAIRLTHLFDKNFYTCEDLVAGVDFLVADYYYRRKTQSNATVFIFAGRRFTIRIKCLVYPFTRCSIKPNPSDGNRC